MDIQTRTAMTVDEYFEWEQLQERKHEYIDGELIEMPGVNSRHDVITVNIIFLLSRLDRTRFTMHTARMRVPD